MNREKGQAIIEFALAMPFLLMFIFFIVDLALFGYSYISVTNAVREGARCGAVGATDDTIVQRVEDTSGGLANFSGATIPEREDFVGGNITVQGDYSYDWITPVGLVPGLSGTIDFTKQVKMRMETKPPYTRTTC
jgi:Flp pilus assembly protein TadG